MKPPLVEPVYTVVPANRVLWEDVQRVFGERGDSHRCQCQWFKVHDTDWRHLPEEERKARLREQTHCNEPKSPTTTGLVAFLDREPVGWCAVEPRINYQRLLTMHTPWAGRDEDPADDGVWVVSCFAVRVGFRHRGVSRPPGRGANLRHRLALSHREDLQHQGADVPAGRPGAPAELQGVRDRADHAHRDQRGRVGGGVPGGRDGVRDARGAHGARLHLLFDVRVPADGRPVLGGGRPDDAGVRDRGDGRADDADGRGPAARRRAFADPGQHEPGGCHLRPGLRLRDSAHRPRRDRADVRQPRERLLLHHRVQRAGPPAGQARRRGRRGHPQGHLPASEVRRGGPHGADLGLRGRGPVGARGAGSLGRSRRRRGRSWQRRTSTT